MAEMTISEYKKTFAISTKVFSCGAEEIRTPDLLNAIQALSQLSYSPASAGRG